MLKAHGKSKTYKFYNYTSGHIHHCTIRNLEVHHHHYHNLFYHSVSDFVVVIMILYDRKDYENDDDGPLIENRVRSHAFSVTQETFTAFPSRSPCVMCTFLWKSQIKTLISGPIMGSPIKHWR
ncbi:hypothetical protein YC2023_039876 [Brassica napus]